jgi:hypothetical protein
VQRISLSTMQMIVSGSQVPHLRTWCAASPALTLCCCVRRLCVHQRRLHDGCVRGGGGEAGGPGPGGGARRAVRVPGEAGLTAGMRLLDDIDDTACFPCSAAGLRVNLSRTISEPCSASQLHFVLFAEPWHFSMQGKADDYEIAAAQIGVEVYSAMNSALGL